jgi:hypothetical protein
MSIAPGTAPAVIANDAVVPVVITTGDTDTVVPVAAPAAPERIMGTST